MKWAFELITFILIFYVECTKGLEDLSGTEIQKCLNCICHARTGCWSRFNCAKYSIDQDYWILGRSHSLGEYGSTEKAYENCMNNENCILNTLKSYTERLGERDCNCDSVFDCKDRLAIHLYGDSCFNPKYTSKYAKRFNECAADIGLGRLTTVEEGCKAQV